MFCLREDGGFKGEEHVIPESLGNKTTVLTPGTVCDRCNTRLSVYDAALVTCPPVALLKAVQGIPNKRDRLPKAVFGKTGLYALDAGEDHNVYLRVPDASAVEQGDGWFEVKLVQRWRSEDWKRLSCALLKAGFEMLAFDNGKAYVLDERFDGLRRAILEGRYSGWIAYSHTNQKLSTELSLEYPVMPVGGTSRLGVSIAATIFGVRLLTTWPAYRDLLHARPDAEQFQYVDFERDASRQKEEVSLSVRVKYGSSSEWNEVGSAVEKIAEIDRHRGEA